MKQSNSKSKILQQSSFVYVERYSDELTLKPSSIARYKI